MFFRKGNEPIFENVKTDNKWYFFSQETYHEDSSSEKNRKGHPKQNRTPFTVLIQYH